MRSELPAIATAAALLLAGCAGADRPAGAAGAAPADVASFAATGPAVPCIAMRGTQLIPAGEQHVMARISANRHYRSDLRSACPGLRRDRTLVLRANGTQMCDLDTFEVVDPISGISFGVCALGSFTPVDVPKGARW